MMDLNDCAALCLLDQDDVVQIAAFDHVPDVAYATLADYVAHAPYGGPAALCRTMIGDIRNALGEGWSITQAKSSWCCAFPRPEPAGRARRDLH